MASAGANLDVALSVSTKLGNHGGGLIVGILALCLQLPTSRIDHLVNKAEAEALEFMDLLHEPTTKR